MAKPKTSWKQCRDYTLINRREWQNSGRKSAILYSGKFTLFHPQTIDPHKITYRMILEDCLELKNKNALSHASLNRYVSAVSTILRFCQKCQILSQDWTVPRFERYPEAETSYSRDAFTSEEINLMIKYARSILANDDLGDMILFATLSGMRQNEILKLPNDKINLEHKSIEIMFPKGKKGKSRYIGIHDSLMPILTKRIALNPYGHTFADDWLNADQMRTWFNRCITGALLKPVGIDSPWKFHGLRHTCGTLLVQSGMNIVDVATHLGHSSTRVTERYLHSFDKDLSKRANSVDFAYV